MLNTGIFMYICIFSPSLPYCPSSVISSPFSFYFHNYKKWIYLGNTVIRSRARSQKKSISAHFFLLSFYLCPAVLFASIIPEIMA